MKPVPACPPKKPAIEIFCCAQNDKYNRNQKHKKIPVFKNGSIVRFLRVFDG